MPSNYTFTPVVPDTTWADSPIRGEGRKISLMFDKAVDKVIEQHLTDVSHVENHRWPARPIVAQSDVVLRSGVKIPIRLYLHETKTGWTFNLTPPEDQDG